MSHILLNYVLVIYRAAKPTNEWRVYEHDGFRLLLLPIHEMFDTKGMVTQQIVNKNENLTSNIKTIGTTQ